MGDPENPMKEILDRALRSIGYDCCARCGGRCQGHGFLQGPS